MFDARRRGCFRAVLTKAEDRMVSEERVRTDLLRMIERLVNFPFPQICRHSVACDLLSLFETYFGGDGLARLAKALVQADDESALAEIESLVGKARGSEGE